MITGYDVSRHQGAVAHEKFAEAGYKFCFVKATEGVGYEDPRFMGNVRGARDAGMLVGAYHFARVSRSPTIEKDAMAEARWHCNVSNPLIFGPLEPALPCVLDIEWDKRVAKDIKAPDLVHWCTVWLEEVERLTGRRPIVYTGPSFWRYKLGGSMALNDYPLWIADYRASSLRKKKPKEIAGWPPAFWQWTGKKSRPDIPSKVVDANFFMGDEDELRAYAKRDPEPNSEVCSDVKQPPWAQAVIAIMGQFAESRRIA